jgi:RND superfamily putative drug exporter
MGLERTGRIVTAGAACLAVVFLSVALVSSVTLGKLFGLGMSLAVLMDATVIRALLVPAFMRMAGNANRWVPRPLPRLQERFGFREAPSPG